LKCKETPGDSTVFIYVNHIFMASKSMAFHIFERPYARFQGFQEISDSLRSYGIL
jgi:hypothetical protein